MRRVITAIRHPRLLLLVLSYFHFTYTCHSRVAFMILQNARETRLPGNKMLPGILLKAQLKQPVCFLCIKLKFSHKYINTFVVKNYRAIQLISTKSCLYDIFCHLVLIQKRGYVFLLTASLIFILAILFYQVHTHFQCLLIHRNEMMMAFGQSFFKSFQYAFECHNGLDFQ